MTAKFRISEQDYLNAQKLHRKLTPKKLWFISLLGSTLTLMALLGPNAMQAMAIGGLIGGITVLLLIPTLIAPYVGKRHYRKYKAIQEELSMSVTDEGIRITTPNGDSIVLWDKVLKWRQSEQYVLVYIMPMLYYIVPTHLTNQGFDLAKLKHFLIQHVGDEC